MRNRFDQHHGHGFPPFNQFWLPSRKRKHEQKAPADLDHFGVANVEGLAACHVKAKRTKRLTFYVTHYLGRGNHQRILVGFGGAITWILTKDRVLIGSSFSVIETSVYRGFQVGNGVDQLREIPHPG
ncbi:MAG: hypothetical protein U0736_17425 [Gemmataceae bacterium]